MFLSPTWVFCDDVLLLGSLSVLLALCILILFGVGVGIVAEFSDVSPLAPLSEFTGSTSSRLCVSVSFLGSDHSVSCCLHWTSFSVFCSLIHCQWFLPWSHTISFGILWVCYHHMSSYLSFFRRRNYVFFIGIYIQVQQTDHHIHSCIMSSIQILAGS